MSAAVWSDGPPVEVSPFPRQADVMQLAATHADHIRECQACRTRHPCGTERVLRATHQTASEHLAAQKQ
jgi:hypothetical protein